MLVSLMASAALFCPQEPVPHRLTSRPSGASDADRLVEANWGEDAPGRQVLLQRGKAWKFEPIRAPRYTDATGAAKRVEADDLVIGLVAGGKPFAYPIKMLGGPQREIINDEQGGVAFCVNW